jgi:hypothetical protein
MFKKDIENRFRYAKKCIVARITPKHTENYKWVSIYPPESENEKYTVLELEMPKYLIDEDWDWASEDEIRQEYEFDNYDDLMIFLFENNFKPENFDYPWNTDFPYHE